MVNCCNLLGAVLVSGFAETGIDAKYLSYGLVDNREPVARTTTSLCLSELLTFDLVLLDDLTDYGRKAGYGGRRGRWTELDPGVSLAHTFSEEDCTWMPTPLDVSMGGSGELHPRSMGHGSGDWGEPTQFVNLSVGLPEVVGEPVLALERDVRRDNGTYLNLELGHEFRTDVDGVTVRPSLGQGWGDRRRVVAYLTDRDGRPYRRAGLMDTAFRLSVKWQIHEQVVLTASLGVSDYLLDPGLRRGARRYEATGRCRESAMAQVGVSVRFSF